MRSRRAPSQPVAAPHRARAEASDAEQARLRECSAASPAWKALGAVPAASGSGARSARTTARTATPGTTSRTTTPAAAPIAGARTASPASRDDEQRLCLALALWNGRDPILKERLFGLTNGEGNHGEDVKELYYYLDATPTHSYLKMLYKYPQRGVPVRASWSRRTAAAASAAPEFELLDTGVFDDDRYFDVFVEYAKAAPGRHPDARHGRTTAARRRPTLHLLPQLWFRNTWSLEARRADDRDSRQRRRRRSRRTHPTLGDYRLYCDGDRAELLFTRQRDQRRAALRPADAAGYFKDAFHDYVVHGRRGRRESASSTGTKAAARYRARRCRPAASVERAAASRAASSQPRRSPTSTRRARRAQRRGRRVLRRPAARTSPTPTRGCVQRQAFAGMIWSKQFYYYDVPEWLQRRPGAAAAAARAARTAATATGRT